MMVPVRSCECIGGVAVAVGDGVELVALDGSVEAQGCVLGVLKSDYVPMDVRDRGRDTARAVVFLEEVGASRARAVAVHPTWLRLSPRSSAVYNDGRIVAWQVWEARR